MPGPGDILDIRVLVQNRSKEAVFVDGRDIIAVVSKTKLDAFFEGTSSFPEYEKNVVAQEISGCAYVLADGDFTLLTLNSAETTGQRPCYCRVTHVNGKKVDTTVCPIS